MLWTHLFDYSDSMTGAGVAVTPNGDVVVAGSYLNEDTGNVGVRNVVLLTAKLDPNGALIWKSRWESGDSAYAQGVAVDRSGNLLFVSTESSRRVIRKFDPSGSLLWTQFLSETTSEHLGAFTGVAVDSTGNIVAVGRAGVAKFDAAGNELWNRIEPTNSSRLDGVAVDSSDSIVVTGSSAGLAAGIGESATAAGELSPPPRRRAPQ